MNATKSLMVLPVLLSFLLLLAPIHGQESNISIGKLTLLNSSNGQVFLAPNWPPLFQKTPFEVRGIVQIAAEIKSMSINQVPALLQFPWNSAKRCYLRNQANFCVPRVVLSPTCAHLAIIVITQSGKQLQRRIDVSSPRRCLQLHIISQSNGQPLVPDVLTLANVPLQLPHPSVPLGTYPLQVEKKGYASYLHPLTVRPGQGPQLVTVKLQPLGRPVVLQVRGDCSWQPVVVPDVVLFNQQALGAAATILPGEYELVIKRLGYYNYRARVTIAPGTQPWQWSCALRARTRTILTKITYDVPPPPPAVGNFQISLTPVGLPEATRLVRAGSAVKPAIYLLRVAQKGYRTIKERVVIGPDEAPYWIDQQLQAQPVPLQLHISYDVRPANGTYQATLTGPDQHTLDITHRKTISPGNYTLTVRQEGYRAPAPRKITVFPGQPCVIQEKLFAQKRALATYVIERLSGEEVEVHQFIINGKPFDPEEQELTSGESVTLKVLFKDYESVQQKLQVPPGAEPLVLELVLKPLRKYHFNVRKDSKVIDGIWYSYQYYYDDVPLEAHHIDREESLRAGRLLYTIRVPPQARFLEAYAGYLYKKRRLQDLRKGLPRRWHLSVVRLLDHLARIRAKYDSARPCLRILRRLLRRRLRKERNLSTVELEMLINMVQGWRFHFPQEQKEQSALLEKLRHLKGRTVFSLGTLKLLLQDPQKRQSVGMLGPKAIPVLGQALADNNPEIRFAAARTLLKFGAAATAVLVKALADPRPAVVMTAAGTLIKIGPPAVVPLTKLLSGADTGSRRTIAHILAQIGSHDARQALLQLLRDEDPQVREVAISALSHSGQQCLPELLQLLQDKQLETRLIAARILRAVEPQLPVGAAWELRKQLESLPVLVDSLGGDPQLQRTAISKLRRKGYEAEQALITALGHSDWKVRQQAAQLLAQMRVIRAWPQLLSLFKDRDPDVARAAMAALAELQPTAAVPALIKIMQARNRLSAAAARTLQKIGRPAVRSLLKLLHSSDQDLHLQTARVLRVIRAQLYLYDHLRRQIDEALDSVPLLLDALKFLPPSQQRLIAQQLCQKGTDVIEALKPLLDNRQDPRRGILVWVLGQLESPAALRILTRLSHDPDVAIRARVAQAIGQIKKTSTIGLLLQLLQDPAPEVERAARTALVTQGRQVLPLLLPLLHGQRSCQRILRTIVDMGHLGMKALLDNLPQQPRNFRWRVTWIVAHITDSRSIQWLRQALNDPDWFVRVCALQGLVHQLPYSPDQLTSLLHCLQDPHGDMRVVAALELAAVKHVLVLQALIKASRSSFPALRKAVAQALGHSTDSQAIGVLMHLCQDPQWYVRAAAAASLGRIAAKSAVPTLLGLLKDKNDEVMSAAALALGRLKSEQAIAPLIALLGQWSYQVRHSASQALRQIGAAAIDPLQRAFANNGPPTKNAAAWILGQLRATTAITLLCQGLQEQEHNLAAICAQALIRIGSPAAEQVGRVLTQGHRQARRWALHILARIGRPTEIPLVLKALDDQHWQIRQAAARTLGYLGAQQKADYASKLNTRLAQVLRDRDADVRHAVSQALAKIGAIAPLTAGDWQQEHWWASQVLKQINVHALPMLRKALKHPNWFIRWWATKNLAQIHDPQAIELVIKALSDHNSHVQDMAVNALVGFGEQALPALIAELHHKNWRVRQKVVRALGRIGSTKAIAALRQALKDPDPDVQKAVIQALEKIGD